jgi:hypothetical protein
MNVKRPVDDTPTYYKKMPDKRAAIDPTNQATTHHSTRRTPPASFQPQAMETEPPAANTANKKMPRQCIPINTRPGDGAGPSSATRPRSPADNIRAAPTGNGPALDAFPVTNSKGSGAAAAQIADQKGKEIADSLCKKLSLDGIDGSAIPRRAVLTCVAGHLAGDQHLVRLGRKMARDTQELLNRYSLSSPPRPAGVFNLAQQQRQPSRSMLNAIVRPTGRSIGGPSCTMMVQIYGQDAIALIDTGALNS